MNNLINTDNNCTIKTTTVQYRQQQYNTTEPERNLKSRKQKKDTQYNVQTKKDNGSNKISKGNKKPSFQEGLTKQ